MDSQKVLIIREKVENFLARGGGGFATDLLKYRGCVAHE